MTHHNRSVPLWILALTLALGPACSKKAPESGVKPGDGQSSDSLPAGAESSDKGSHSSTTQVPAHKMHAVQKGGESTPQKVAEPTPEAPKPKCFTVEYKHKGLKKGESPEDYVDYKHLIELPTEGLDLKLNHKSVCVRVNGTPARFQWVKSKKHDQLLVDTLAGPDTKITASFCTGDAKCQQDCKVPKDEFMAALGGSDMEMAGTAGDWDVNGKAAAPSKDEKELQSELKDMGRTLAGGSREKVFTGWIQKDRQASCGRKS